MKTNPGQFLLISLFLLVTFSLQVVNAQTGNKTNTAFENIDAKTKAEYVPMKLNTIDELLADKEEERNLIENALPSMTAIQPKKPRRLLIFDLNVNYGGHPSIKHADYAFARMGEKTGAYETVISNDTAMFRRETLETFDAVFFNNNVGNLFKDKELRQNLLDFVYAGGGILGLHGSTAAFAYWPGAHEDWPEFGLMLGARGANHRENKEHVYVKLDDSSHPVNRVFKGKDFDYKDEFFRFTDPYSRDRVRVLLSMDTLKTDLEQGRAFGNVTRQDKDYAVAWVRQYGRGRAFYCTIGHHPSVFWDPLMLQFYLNGIQFALGDTEASAIPSSRLTPAIKSQDDLGWKFGIEAYTFKNNTFFEAIEKTRELGLQYVGGLNVQPVSDDIPKNFDYTLTEEEVLSIRNKLIAEGLSMLTYYIFDIPGDEETVKRIFEFGRKLGVETFISEPKIEDLDLIEQYCEKYNIKLALHNHGERLSPVYMHPEKIVELTKGRSPLIGAACDFGHWAKEGINPLEAVKTLGHRVITMQVHDQSAINPEGHDVPWGTGVIKLDAILEHLKKENIKPVMFGLEYSYNWDNSLPDVKASIDYFNRKSIELAED